MFELELDSRHLELLHELSFHNCCVLKVKILRDLSQNAILVSAATDGRLAFWNVGRVHEHDAALEPFGCLKLHQSGINSVDFKWIEQNRWLILTGSDDNALICSEVEIDCHGLFVRLIQQHKRFPHAAQISGNLLAALLVGY